MSDKTYPDVPCSACGALAGEPCVSSSGNDVKNHAERESLLDAQAGQIQPQVGHSDD